MLVSGLIYNNSNKKSFCIKIVIMKKIIFISLIFLVLLACKKEVIEEYIVKKECDNEIYLVSDTESTVYLVCNNEELSNYNSGDVVSVKVKETKYNCKYAQYGCSTEYYNISKPVSIIKFK